MKYIATFKQYIFFMPHPDTEARYDTASMVLDPLAFSSIGELKEMLIARHFHNTSTDTFSDPQLIVEKERMTFVFTQDGILGTFHFKIITNGVIDENKNSIEDLTTIPQ